MANWEDGCNHAEGSFKGSVGKVDVYVDDNVCVRYGPNVEDYIGYPTSGLMKDSTTQLTLTEIIVKALDLAARNRYIEKGRGGKI